MSTYFRIFKCGLNDEPFEAGYNYYYVHIQELKTNIYIYIYIYIYICEWRTSFLDFHTEPIESQPIIADGTPRVIWDGDHWQYDVINQASHRPDVLIPHKIHHMTPDAKFIVIMREPTSRLVSDYKFFTRVKRKVDPHGFHDKVSSILSRVNGNRILTQLSIYQSVYHVNHLKSSS